MHSSRCRCRCCVLVAADGRRRRRGRRGGGCWVLLVATTIVFAVVVIVVVAIPRHRDRPWRTSARTRPPRRLSPPARELQCGAGRIIIEGSSLSCVVRSSRRVARVGLYIPFNIQHFRHIPPPPQLTLIIICPSPPSLLSRIHRLSHSFCIVDFRGRTTTTHQNKSGHNGTRSHVHLRRVSRKVGSGGAVWGAGRRENERTRGRRRREAVFRDYIHYRRCRLLSSSSFFSFAGRLVSIPSLTPYTPLYPPRVVRVSFALLTLQQRPSKPPRRNIYMSCIPMI